MDNRDQNAIDELFRKIEDVRRQSGPRDAEAEAYIRSLVARDPAAAYYMAQTIIVQEQALNAAQQRIDELERQPGGRAGGGLLGSLFGGGAPQRQPSYAEPRRRSPEPQAQPWGPSRSMGGGMGGGGFLAGAAQTAVGVAGGVVLGNMLADFFSPDEAATAGLSDEAGGDQGGGDAGETDVADSGDFGGGDLGGGDFGDFG